MQTVSQSDLNLVFTVAFCGKKTSSQIFSLLDSGCLGWGAGSRKFLRPRIDSGERISSFQDSCYGFKGEEVVITTLDSAAFFTI